MITAESSETEPVEAKVTNELLDTWATDPKGPVALHLKQKLLPVETVEGDGGIIYPPTYADIGYNIDTLSDGTRVALIDSVGSQANRLEPIFKAARDGQAANPLAKLVPQIQIVLNHAATEKSKENRDRFKEKRSILDLAHRIADAVVQSSPELTSLVTDAFETLRRTGNAGPLCSLAPTSLVFGVWDSRGGSNEKRPRLVRAVIRAWNVDVLHAAAQFNSVWKVLDEEQQGELKSEANKKGKAKLSDKGLADAPAVFRKTDKIPKFRNDAPNPEARVLGGVLVHGRIEREVTVNLVALRGLRGQNPDETRHIQKYLLGVSLLAATAEIDLFLREGCHLRYTSDDVWHAVPRRGDPTPVELGSGDARSLVQTYASNAVEPFKKNWPEKLEHVFDLKAAKKLLAKKDEEHNSEA